MSGCGGGPTESNNDDVIDIITQPALVPDCNEHFVFGVPVSVSISYTGICHEDVFIAFDEVAKVPRFTMHELTINESLVYIDRDVNNIYLSDPSLSESLQASQKDYNNMYDRGHMQPWADTSLLLHALDTNFYTNITPQLPEFNRGIWQELEKAIRIYVYEQGSDIFIITGALSGIKTIGNRVEVPSGFYKVLFDPAREIIGAYLIYQEGDLNLELKEYAISVDQLEELTGFDFYPGMDVEKENKLEASSKSIL